jgi:hypothetical protein
VGGARIRIHEHEHEPYKKFVACLRSWASP